MSEVPSRDIKRIEKLDQLTIKLSASLKGLEELLTKDLLASAAVLSDPTHPLSLQLGDVSEPPAQHIHAVRNAAKRLGRCLARAGALVCWFRRAKGGALEGISADALEVAADAVELVIDGINALV